MRFYDKYIWLCNSINKSPSTVAIELGIGKPSVTRWKRGTKPRDSTKLRIANYFGITVEELDGDELPTLPPQSAKKAPIENDERDERSITAKKLLDIIYSSSTDDANDILRYAEYIQEKRGKKS